MSTNIKSLWCTFDLEGLGAMDAEVKVSPSDVHTSPISSVADTSAILWRPKENLPGLTELNILPSWSKTLMCLIELYSCLTTLLEEAQKLDTLTGVKQTELPFMYLGKDASPTNGLRS